MASGESLDRPDATAPTVRSVGHALVVDGGLTAVRYAE